MPIPLDAPEVLNREFLEVRAKILEIAAALDRLDRAAGTVEGDARLERIRQGLAMLSTRRADRAELIMKEHLFEARDLLITRVQDIQALSAEQSG